MIRWQGSTKWCEQFERTEKESAKIEKKWHIWIFQTVKTGREHKLKTNKNQGNGNKKEKQ